MSNLKKRSLKEINPAELVNPSQEGQQTEYSEEQLLNKTFPYVALGIFNSVQHLRIVLPSACASNIFVKSISLCFGIIILAVNFNC